ncbi:cytochrome P450 [Streptomyces sp. FIT100]|uniref:cytochrome P450 n=1 Tax=Streptomyces sp. FIT100 TaxID=2837956 RepID=UPI0021CAB911|nr:cytochrome P450 [Streptomyces sp. FIT100]UUN25508.1 cytochrome P450 [Streptomyces sp. FIT100]
MTVNDHRRAVPSARRRIPLVGNALSLLHDPVAFLTSLHRQGDIVRVHIGAWPVYFVTTPELVWQVLVTDAVDFELGRILERQRVVFRNGIVTADGDLHRRQRLLMQPAFHRSRIEHYITTMNEHADAMAGAWRPGQSLALDEHLHELMLTIITSTMFSADPAAAAVAEVRRSLPLIAKGVMMRSALPPVFDRLPIPLNRRFTAASERLRAIIIEIIDNHGGDGHDLLSLLRTARDDQGRPMSREQLCDELIGIMLGGTEATANIVAWAFHELAQAPHCADRLSDEIDTVLGGRQPGGQDLARLPYTANIINETLRLHSPLLNMRRATQPVRIAGVTLPTGTEVAFSPYVLHRDPRLHDQPDRFVPERWDTEDPALSHTMFLPFAAGPHKCIGESFARAEIAITIAAIASRWRLHAAPGNQVREVLASVPRPNALPMIVQQRRIDLLPR